jgi:signal transduction histidine kinase
MKSKTTRRWPIFVMGFGGMLMLIFLPGIAALRQSAQIYDEAQEIQRSHEEKQDTLFRIERLMLQTSVTVREFLLDNSPVTAYMYREQFATSRRSLESALRELAQSAPEDQTGMFDQLRAQIEAYWRSIVPVFGWSPSERAARATYFLREQQRPRREGILAVADEIVRLSRENYRRRYEEMQSSQRRYRKQLEVAVGVAFLLGLAVAVWTGERISALERQAEQQRLATVQAEQQMRTLSAGLMKAQEDERRTIARELHDEVGQMLTSLRFELGALDRLNAHPTQEYHQHVQEAKATAEQTLRTVRDIAIGLRPSVLDLGLESALQWQARNFSRSTGTEASLRIFGTLPPLPDTYLTCIYRVVQEALTNSARHARARNVEVSVHAHRDTLELTVTDDGVGLAGDWNRGRGMGLASMEERVRELGGRFQMSSRDGAGVLIDVSLPVPKAGDA